MVPKVGSRSSLSSYSFFLPPMVTNFSFVAPVAAIFAPNSFAPCWTSSCNASPSIIELVVFWISLAASGLICSSYVKLVAVAILEIKLVGALAVISEKTKPILKNIKINELNKIFKVFI